MAKIALVMILKNEEKTVYDAIVSCLDFVDSAIIHIDNKTSDKTKEECVKALKQNSDLKYIINDFEFKNDFAQARNDAIQNAKNALCDYVLILDGHEIITASSQMYLRELKKGLTEDIYDFTIIIPTQTGESWFQQPRLFLSTIHYDFPVHNTILQTARRLSVPQIKIYHNQPTDVVQRRKEQRAEMNIEDLLKKAKNGDVRSMFYLANTYKEMDNADKAIEWYESYISQSDFNSERYQARLYLAELYKNLNDIEIYENVLWGCFEDDVRRNEHLIGLGDIEFDKKNYQASERWYLFASTLSLPDKFLNIEKEFYTWIPYYKIALARMGMNNLEGTREAINNLKTYDANVDVAYTLEKLVDEKVEEYRKNAKPKICKLYAIASDAHFLESMLPEIDNNFYLRFENVFNPDHANLADVIFCDWGDANAIALSHYETKAKKILRIHSYEVFNEHFRKNINYDAFDKIIFINNAIKAYLNMFVSFKFDQCVILPNGINTDNFKIGVKKHNTIAYAGYFKSVKGIDLLIEFMKMNPSLELHLAGNVSPEFVDYYRYLTKDKIANVFLYPWQNDLNSFFTDKQFAISSSYRESQHLTVLEAMATGCVPLVRNWSGAENIYPVDNIWKNLSELKDIISEFSLGWNDEDILSKQRIYVEQKFYYKDIEHDFIEIIRGVYNES